MRDFTVESEGTVNLEGVLFADGTVVLHYLPPAHATIILPSWNDAAALFGDDDKIVWLNDPTSAYRAV
jgi:hypothetical protein